MSQDPCNQLHLTSHVDCLLAFSARHFTETGQALTLGQKPDIVPYADSLIQTIQPPEVECLGPTAAAAAALPEDNQMLLSMLEAQPAKPFVPFAFKIAGRSYMESGKLQAILPEEPLEALGCCLASVK